MELLREIIWTLLLRPGRMAMTLLGVAWGTATILVLLGWGQGFESLMEDGLGRSGRELVIAFAGRVGKDYSPLAHRRLLWINWSDVKYVRTRASLLGESAAESRRSQLVSAGNRKLPVDVRGVEPAVLAIRKVDVVEGRGILAQDLEARSRVAVIGQQLQRSLFGAESALGRWVRVDDRAFRVVGILGSPPPALLRDRSDISEQLWIPLTSFFATASRFGADAQVVSVILFRVSSRGDYQAAKQQLRRLLARRLQIDPEDEEALLFVSAWDLLERIPFEALSGYLSILGVVTVLVSAIGVTNLMLMSVYERRFEIGLRRALGARRSRIVQGIVLETIVLVSAGGLLGLGLGWLACVGLGHTGRPSVIPAPIIDASTGGISIAVVIVGAVLAGILPAVRAVRIEASTALRSS